MKNKKIPIAKIASPINSLEPLENIELNVIAEKILTTAIPMLSHLTKPALLLPGKLQAVMKAQRIFLTPGNEYEGVWHKDGKNENIVAVVIYYYRCSKGLIGGDLEFVDKRPANKIWVSGDCTPEDYTEETFKKDFEKLPKARVPVKKGTLVVFSNYQMIHRLLKIIQDKNVKEDPDSPDKSCSRDFFLFFIVDQNKPLKNTNDFLEEKDYVLKDNERKDLRKKLFLELIEPTGKFSLNNDYVYSTGNGSIAELGWSKNNESYSDYDDENLDRLGIERIKKMNENPPLNRGVSWSLEGNVKKYKKSNYEDEEIIEDEEEPEEDK